MFLSKHYNNHPPSLFKNSLMMFVYSLLHMLCSSFTQSFSHNGPLVIKYQCVCVRERDRDRERVCVCVLYDGCKKFASSLAIADPEVLADFMAANYRRQSQQNCIL